MFSDHNEIKLGINDREMTENFPSTCKLNSLLQNNPRMEKLQENRIGRYNETKMYQKIIMLRQYKGKFIALNVYIRKKEQVSNH